MIGNKGKFYCPAEDEWREVYYDDEDFGNELDLASCGLTEIPKGLDKINQLNTLFISGNKISEISNLENLSELSFLSLNDNQITEIKGLDDLKNLRWLNLGYNNIEEAPDGLDKTLPSLFELDIRNNPISLEDECEKLKDLFYDVFCY